MSNTKPSKNAKCPCGSGQKYRKCHGKQRRLLSEVAQHFWEKEQKRLTFQDKHGQARPPLSTMMDGKRIFVIGESIYIQTQDGPYDFINVVHGCGLELFSNPYLDDQELIPLERRHPALQWMYTFIDHQEKLRELRRLDSQAQLIGAGAAWIRFGYDLFTIRDCVKLQARLKKRLLNIQDFQAARHELAVAAMCVAAGFDLDFEDEADNSTTHPEFVGTDLLTGIKIAVEAKSRRRHGVKGFSGGHAIPPGQTVGIRALVVDGFKKAVLSRSIFSWT